MKRNFWSVVALLAGAAVGYGLHDRASQGCSTHVVMRLQASSITVDGMAMSLPSSDSRTTVISDWRGGPDVYADLWDPDEGRVIEGRTFRRLP